MANPWDSDPIVGGGPVYGPAPDPAIAEGRELQNESARGAIEQRPVQIEGQQLGNVRTQQQIQAHPLDVQHQKITNPTDLFESFRADKSVASYREAIPNVIAMTQARPGGEGDLTTIYGWAKTMDPTGSVREGDTELATSASPVWQRAELMASKVRAGNLLSPQQRVGLTEEARNKARQLNQGYSQVYEQYRNIAQQAGIDPALLGPHDGDKFKAVEEEYVRKHNGAPGALNQNGTGDIGFNTPADHSAKGADAFQSGLYSAMRSGKIGSAAEMKVWVDGFNSAHGTQFSADLSNGDTIRAIKAAKAGKPFNVQTPEYHPDISDVRGGEGDTMQSHGRGAADAMTVGTLDKLQAGVDTLFKGGTMDENLARQYAITDYDQQNHPYARMGGQALGSAVLPMGEMSSIPQIALKSGALGGAYAAGSSRSLAEVPQNALLGTVAGAATGALLGKGSQMLANRGAAREVPPLVDPATGELNAPMDAMRPAERMQAMQDYGLNTVTPGMAGGRSARVLEQGLNNLPGSAGVMEDVNSAASRELRRGMQGVAQKFGSSKTLNEGGSEIQRGAREWMSHADIVDGKVYNAIPISPKAPTTNTSTVALLKDLGAKLESNPALQEEIKDPVLGRYLIAIQEHGLNWGDLKDFRSYIGNKIGQFRFSQDARQGDYRALYGALSEDMRNTAASNGPQAIRAFERANAFHAAKEQRIEGALVQIIGNDAKAAPEKAAAAIQTMTKGGKGSGDLAKLAQIRASTIKSGAWDEIAATLIHLGGQPANSEGRAFRPDTFVNWYADMAEPARRMLFKPELRKSLDGFVAVNQQLSRIKGLTNSSNTTPTMIGSGVIGAAGIMSVSHPLALLPVVAGGFANFGMAKAWTNPAFVRWATGYSKALASGSPNAAKSQIGRLSKIAATNPNLREALIGLEQKLLAAANDNAGRTGQLAASPNEGPQPQE